MAKQTKKDQILESALTLFAEKGYDGVGVDLIAESIGIKGPSLYNHFKGKEAILDALVDKFEQYYADNFENIKERKIPKSAEALVEMTLNQINFTMHDSKIIKVRRLLAMEQFRNEKIAKVATMHHLTGIESMYKEIFLEMMKEGIMKEDDPAVLALEYMAPVTLLLHTCDREPDMEYKCMQKIRKHIKHFVDMYVVKK